MLLSHTYSLAALTHPPPPFSPYPHTPVPAHTLSMRSTTVILSSSSFCSVDIYTHIHIYTNMMREAMGWVGGGGGRRNNSGMSGNKCVGVCMSVYVVHMCVYV